MLPVGVCPVHSEGATDSPSTLRLFANWPLPLDEVRPARQQERANS